MKTSFFLAVILTVSSLTVSAQVTIGENNNLQNVQITQNGEDVLKGNNCDVKSHSTYRTRTQRLVNKIKQDTIFEKDYVLISEIHETRLGNNLISSDTISKTIHRNCEEEYFTKDNIRKALNNGLVKVDTIKPKYSQIFEMEKKVTTWLYVKEGTTSLVSESFTESKWLAMDAVGLFMTFYLLGLFFFFLLRKEKGKAWYCLKIVVFAFCICLMVYITITAFSFIFDKILLILIIIEFTIADLGKIRKTRKNNDNTDIIGIL